MPQNASEAIQESKNPKIWEQYVILKYLKWIIDNLAYIFAIIVWLLVTGA